jgi:hypothetical protein
VGGDVPFAAEGELDLAVSAHHVGHALGQSQQRPRDLVGLDDPTLLIADDRVWQVQALAELLGDSWRVLADPDQLAPQLADRQRFPAELAGLSRSAGREGLGKKEEDDRAIPKHVVQGGLPDREVGSLIAGPEHDRTIALVTGPGQARSGLECPRPGG